MNGRRAAAALVAGALGVAVPAYAERSLDPIELTCGHDLPDEAEFRITYGPHWDGAWRITAVRPATGTPYFEVDVLGVARADHRVDVLETHRRPALDRNVREVRRAALLVITEMRTRAQRGETPELRREQRPFTVHVQGIDGGPCADGYARWPRIPGGYFFEAMDMLRESVVDPGAVGDPWTSINLHLRQIRSPWR